MFWNKRYLTVSRKINKPGWKENTIRFAHRFACLCALAYINERISRARSLAPCAPVLPYWVACIQARSCCMSFLDCASILHISPVLLSLSHWISHTFLFVASFFPLVEPARVRSLCGLSLSFSLPLDYDFLFHSNLNSLECAYSSYFLLISSLSYWVCFCGFDHQTFFMFFVFFLSFFVLPFSRVISSFHPVFHRMFTA